MVITAGTLPEAAEALELAENMDGAAGVENGECDGGGYEEGDGDMVRRCRLNRWKLCYKRLELGVCNYNMINCFQMLL